MEQLNIFALFTCDNDFVVQEDGNNCAHTMLVKFLLYQLKL